MLSKAQYQEESTDLEVGEKASPWPEPRPLCQRDVGERVNLRSLGVYIKRGLPVMLTCLPFGINSVNG